MMFFMSLWLSVPVMGMPPSFMGVLHPRLGGKKPCCKASRHITVSIDPDALVVCPVNAFVEEKAGICVPHILSIAASSDASLLGVPVPCAFT